MERKTYLGSKSNLIMVTVEKKKGQREEVLGKYFDIQQEMMRT